MDNKLEQLKIETGLRDLIFLKLGWVWIHPNSFRLSEDIIKFKYKDREGDWHTGRIPIVEYEKIRPFDIHTYNFFQNCEIKSKEYKHQQKLQAKLQNKEKVQSLPFLFFL
jgi:hypothetical protein